MSRGLNKVMVIGRLGQDPEMKYMRDGKALATFSVAVTDTWKDKQTGEMREATDWINVEVWGNSAEACGKYLNKGKQVYVEGTMKTDNWEDKDTGKKMYRTKVRADRVDFLGGKREEEGGNRPYGDGTQENPTYGKDQSAPKQDELDDDIPF